MEEALNELQFLDCTILRMRTYKLHKLIIRATSKILKFETKQIIETGLQNLFVL